MYKLSVFWKKLPHCHSLHKWGWFSEIGKIHKIYHKVKVFLWWFVYIFKRKLSILLLCSITLARVIADISKALFMTLYLFCMTFKQFVTQWGFHRKTNKCTPFQPLLKTLFELSNIIRFETEQRVGRYLIGKNIDSYLT